MRRLTATLFGVMLKCTVKGCEGKSSSQDAAQRAPARWERGALKRVNMVPEPRTEPVFSVRLRRVRPLKRQGYDGTP